MRNLTNTMIAWTPATRPDFDTAGLVALIPHPWNRSFGPFPYARDFGASMRYVREASLDDRRKMLADVLERILSDGLDRARVQAVIGELEEAQ